VAVIPAGGLGGQMYPVTSGMPKTLLPVNHMPLLIQILRKLNSKVFKKCIVLCNEWHKMIKCYLDAFRSQIPIKYECIKTNKLLPFFLKELLEDESELSDPFLLHYCDILIEKIDWEWTIKTYEYQRKNNNIIGMFLVSPYFNYSVGVIASDPEGNLITGYEQKPQRIIDGYANCAVALLSKEFAMRYIRKNDLDIFDKGQALDKALKEQKAISLKRVGKWHHLQQIRDWLRAQKKYYEHIPF
jgi:NDP-sugar pyrophosphorylase family protein